MKKLFTLVLIAASLVSFGQEPISRGSIGIGGYMACPQSELKTVQYDEGFGININYLSPKFPYKSPVNFQIGARVDFAGMKSKSFEVELATPVDDLGDLDVSNSMAGIFINGRINFGGESKVQPFVDLLVGNRTYTTNGVLTAQNPDLNPDFESIAYYNRVVHTSRFHYGGGVGVVYQVTPKFGLESSVVYTAGGAGVVQPLTDVVQNGNEVNYNYSTAKTDILLINVGVRFNLFYNPNKVRAPRTPTTPTAPNTTTPPTETNKRYKDPSESTTPTKTTPTKTSDPDMKDKDTGGDTGTETETKKKSPIGVKPNKPKSGGID
jgi:hypothetical protein